MTLLKNKAAKKANGSIYSLHTSAKSAARKLFFSVSKTMTLAQRLYESGLITYMRTDSVNLSKEAQGAALRKLNRVMAQIMLEGAKF